MHVPTVLGATGHNTYTECRKSLLGATGYNSYTEYTYTVLGLQVTTVTLNAHTTQS